VSKGSNQRPYSVSQKEYDTRWDAIFSRDLKDDEDQKLEDEAFDRIVKPTETKDSQQGG
jgi:hypothetical protein